MLLRVLGLLAAFLLGAMASKFFGRRRQRGAPSERERRFEDFSPIERAELFTVLREPNVKPLGKDRRLPACRVVLTEHGLITESSEGFCRLVGYSAEELQGQSIEWLTAADTVHIPRHLAAIFHFTSFRGLWMFVHRDGQALLVNYEGKCRADLSIEMYVESNPSVRSR